MPVSERVAVFGIGSTNFRSAVATPQGTFTTDIDVEPTRIDALPEQVCDRLGVLEAECESIDAVSIACAGLVDAETGIVEEMDTPDDDVVRDVRLGPVVSETTGHPVRLENDCTAAALGEWRFGAGRRPDCASVVHVTLGTGIGAGVVERGHVLRGANGNAAEVGLFSIGPDRRTSSGVPGAMEAYCSGRGIAGYVSELLATEERETALAAMEPVTAPDLFEAVADGDPVASEYLDGICRYLGAGLGSVINAYDPGVITIGGGVGGSNFEVLYDRVFEHIDAHSLPAVASIERTELGDEIGLYGAIAPFAGSEAGFGGENESVVVESDD